MTTSSTSKPKILRIGKIEFGTKKWEELGKVAEVIDCTSKDREEFFKDLKNKYSGVTCITRTFASVSQTGRFDEELSQHLPESVRSVSHTGAGYDQIDVEPFTKKGIQISNVTTPVEAPTADTAVFLVLATTRNFQQGHDLAVQGKWPKDKCAGAKLGHEPEGKTLGIYGMGGIGRAIHNRLKPFNYGKIIYHNRSQLKPELENGAEYVSFDSLLSDSDIILISVPLNGNTRHSINAETISKMKDGVVLINTARGAVVNEAELIKCLQSGKVGAYGSDVFEHEPEVPQVLLDMPNVVSLPHMGTHTYESIKNLEDFVVENVFDFLYTGKVKTIVPEQYSLQIKEGPILSK
ncbi:uncharacterized protein PRCAT00004892001 [Priceomyces carsonii]|uniref:uncharacterized protein n=1 Tax=Priceomyces carsonii TaxID=28549 RepID=UPI002ED8A2B4|nr:unnamed protein product [Priceomyces carsonii]